MNHQEKPLRFIVVHEENGFGAGCLDAEDLFVFGDTREELLTKLPGAIRQYFGRARQFRVLTPK